MTLQIYTGSNQEGLVSQGGTFTSPLTYHVSQNGGTSESRLFLRTDPSEALSDGVLTAKDATLPDESAWISFAPDVNGAAGVYESTFEFDLALGEELPFWLKVEVPSGTEQGLKTDISIASQYVRVAS